MLRVGLTFGEYDGPRWVHWITWLWSWSFWIALGTNSTKSHALTRWTQAQLREKLGARFSRVLARLVVTYPELAASIWAGCDMIIDATVYPGSDCDGRLVKSGVAIRPAGYQKNKREEIILFPNVPDKVLDGLLARCGVNFWWWGLFRLLIPKWLRPKPPADWREGDAFCDELIFVEAEDTGAPLIHPDVSPCDALPEYLHVSPFGIHLPEVLP